MSANDFTEAGRVLTAIRRSESAAKSAEVAAWKRHQERCEKLLAGVSPVVRRLIETHREAEREAAGDAAAESAMADALVELLPGWSKVRASDALAEHAADRASDDLVTLSPRLTADPGPSTALVKERAR